MFGLPGLRYRLFWMWFKTVAMDDSSYGTPVQTFVDDHYSMRPSNDSDRYDPIGLSSLGVVDLDTSIVPDVFGLLTPGSLYVAGTVSE